MLLIYASVLWVNGGVILTQHSTETRRLTLLLRQHFFHQSQANIVQASTSPYKPHATSLRYSYVTESNMKQFSLSDDRIVIVKKAQGQYSVTVTQKDSDMKIVEFSPNR